MNFRNILLVGFMGAGKSTVGRELARRRGCPFIDLDARIEAARGKTIREIFASEGEEAFREMESATLRELDSVQGAVIATGGGIVQRAANREFLKKVGFVIHLRARFETLLKRMAGSRARPLADTKEGEGKLRLLLESRKGFYEEADLIVDTDGLKGTEVVERILREIKEKSGGIACELTVPLGEHSYPILVGCGVLGRLGEILAQRGFPQRLSLVTNTTVNPLYGNQAEESLRKAGFDLLTIVLPDGEQFKNQETVTTIYDRLVESGFDRGSALVALGGGVVGDIAGFAAATFMRGIPYAQVPTTLLAQVDSSVGGKTGINHPLGKNLIGAFHQPRLVFIDVETLHTLPAREFSAGMAEIIKYGMIWDRDFFQWLEDHRESLLRKDSEELIGAIRQSCRIKAEIVGRDEREGSLRAVLNFGHTLGHAVENLAGYGVYRHGEAVAVGMHAAALGSLRLGYCAAADLKRLKGLLRFFQLPLVGPEFAPELYLAAMARDKKNQGGVMRFVFNEGIGGFRIEEIPSPQTFFPPLLADLSDG